MNDPAFHSLPCCGFLKEPGSSRYAYLFRVPRLVTQIDGLSTSDIVMKTLHDLFTLTHLRPSVNQRVSIAVVLAETVLQLHTAGWLHKSIRPDNVLFFKSSSEEWISNNEIPAAYLGGYEYARADNPLETSEDPSTRRSTDLYRHTLSMGHGRTPYSQRFDLYSLGCVLLELGFWAPLETVLLQCVRSESSHFQFNILPGICIAPADDTEYYHMMSGRQRLLQGQDCDRLRSELEFRMGHAYARVVRNCLTARMDSDQGLDEDFENSIDVQEDILAKLRKLLNAV